MKNLIITDSGGSIETMIKTVQNAVRLSHILEAVSKPCLLGAIVLLSACSATTINIAGTFPAPLVRKLPLTVGVYYDDAFTNHSFIEINDNTGDDQYIINSGSSQIALFNTMLPAVFEEVIYLDSIDSAGDYNNLDAVFMPAIEEFQQTEFHFL